MADRPNGFSHAGHPNVERPLERFLRPRGDASSNAGAADAPTGQSSFAQHADGEALMLDFVLASGDHLGLSYAYLTAVKLDAAGTLVIEYTQSVVTIQGRGLLAIYNNILTHQAFRIEASALPFDDASGDAWVKSITVEERG